MRKPIKKYKTFDILVDMDEVTADLAKPWEKWVQENGDPDFLWANVKSWNTHAYSSIGKKVYEFLQQEGLFLFLEPVEGAIEGINHLRRKGHRITWCTSNPTEQSKDEKIEWLKEHFKWFKPETDIVFSHNKCLVPGDIIIDDRAKTLFEFPGTSIAMDAEYNKHYPGFRAKSWPEVIEIVRQLSMYT